MRGPWRGRCDKYVRYERRERAESEPERERERRVDASHGIGHTTRKIKFIERAPPVSTPESRPAVRPRLRAPASAVGRAHTHTSLPELRRDPAMDPAAPRRGGVHTTARDAPGDARASRYEDRTIPGDWLSLGRTRTLRVTRIHCTRSWDPTWVPLFRNCMGASVPHAAQAICTLHAS